MEPSDADRSGPRRGIVILDFGGQYAHLIARRVRAFGVFSEIRDAQTSARELRNAAGIILSGGPQSVYDPKSPQADPEIFTLGIPVLGICYGLQWMAKALGGEVRQGKVKEYGRTAVRKSEVPVAKSKTYTRERANLSSGDLFADCPEEFTVWMSHGDEASKLPPGFRLALTSEACANAAFADASRRFYAVQFHPEVTHTECGQRILKRFVDLCDADPWSIESYAKKVGDEIKAHAGDRNVFMLVSGGVDSTVAFVLLNNVLGTERVQGLIVDTGLMRKDEVATIVHAFAALGIGNLRVEMAQHEFFANLRGVTDPEEKRKVIGNTFLDVQKRVFQEMGLGVGVGWLLGQGTIYPDTIETGATKHADQIKTHHNRVEAIQRMIDQGLVIEPLRDLYKDEVRMLGEELGLPHDLVWRHPFPGPGLGVRILCAKEPHALNETGYLIPVPHLPLPVKSVGVQGDGRSFRHPVALFSKTRYPSVEHWKLATEIPNRCPDFNRVVFCTSHDAPPKIFFTPGECTEARAGILREADALVDRHMRDAGLYGRFWQFPVILLPFGTSKGGESIVLRPVESTEAMTANAAALPRDLLARMTEDILALKGIDCVFLDLTHKPPGTIEWE